MITYEPKESVQKLIKYLVVNVQKKYEKNPVHKVTSVSLLGVSKELEVVSHLDICLANTVYNSPKSLPKNIVEDMPNFPNYVACLWEPKSFVAVLHDFLQKNRDGNIEIVAHDTSKNLVFLNELFESHGYTFLNASKDKNINHVGETPLFSLVNHDTREINLHFNVQSKSQNINSDQSLIDIAKLLNIPVPKNRISSSSSDCFLCASCFIKFKHIMNSQKYSDLVNDISAKNLDYGSVKDHAPSWLKKLQPGIDTVPKGIFKMIEGSTEEMGKFDDNLESIFASLIKEAELGKESITNTLDYYSYRIFLAHILEGLKLYNYLGELGPKEEEELPF